MKKAITLMLAMFALSGTAAYADNHTTGVAQVFGCTLHEGRTMLDAREILRDLAANATANPSPDPRWGIFVWLPMRGTSEADFILGVLNSDLRTMSAGAAAVAQSEAGQAITRRMQATADCGSAIMSSEQIADGAIGMTADTEVDAIIETFACDINSGSDMDDVDKAVAYWQSQYPAIGSEALESYEAYLWRPIRGGFGNDFYWIGNSPNLENWGNGLQDYLDSEQGQKAQARFDEHSSCTSNMWAGYWLVVPKEF